MIPLAITKNIDDAPWRDCDGAPLVLIERICRIPKGTSDGSAAVAIMVRTPDDDIILARTTLKLLATAVNVLQTAEERGL